MKAKLGGRTWAALLTFGLVGQIAWVIENMYFNVFLYNTISGDTSMIAAMVAWSAVTATATTLLMGALSDRVGKRKLFICGGYLLWGISTAAFGLVTVENAAKLFPAADAARMAALLVVVIAFSRSLTRVSSGTALGMFLLYACLTGVSLSSVFLLFDVSGIFLCFLATAASFGAMALYGMRSRKNLAAWGGTLFGALIGLLVLMVALAIDAEKCSND